MYKLYMEPFNLQCNMHTPPTDDMVCLSQEVIQTSTVLGGRVSYFIMSEGGGGFDCSQPEV